MRFPRRTSLLLWHAISLACSAGVLTAIPVVIYFAGAFVTNDAGGPMAVIMIPLLSLAAGCAVAFVVLLPVAALTQRLSRKRAVPLWLPPVLFFLASFGAFLLWNILSMESPPPIGRLGFAASVSGYLALGFVVYWLTLILGPRFLGYLASPAWST